MPDAVFGGNPQSRAKDRDRDRAIYVVEAALRNRQISQQDRDLRVDRVRAAATIGELDGLVRDIAAPPPLPATTVAAPAPVAAGTPAPAAPTATAPVPADLYGPRHSGRRTVATRTRSSSGGTVGRKFAVGCIGVALTFFIGPIIAGVSLFASSMGTDSDGAVASDPIAVGPPFELTREGIRDYLGTFEDSFDSTEVVRAVFYDDYVVSWVPTGDGGETLWTYRDGAFQQLGDPMSGSTDSGPVDLADLKPGRVMALVDTARTTLNVDEPFTTYLIYDRDVIDNDPQVAVYLSNEQGQSGYLLGDLRGNVISTQAN